MAAITALMNVPLQPAEIRPFAPELKLFEQQQPENVTPFQAAFNSAMGMFNDTNMMINEMERLQLEFATGRLDDILAVQTAQDRANNALTFTSQITSRIIEAYREIMRMQV